MTEPTERAPRARKTAQPEAAPAALVRDLAAEFNRFIESCGGDVRLSLAWEVQRQADNLFRTARSSWVVEAWCLGAVAGTFDLLRIERGRTDQPTVLGTVPLPPLP